jgi:hypothetical protein
MICQKPERGGGGTGGERETIERGREKERDLLFMIG